MRPRPPRRASRLLVQRLDPLQRVPPGIARASVVRGFFQGGDAEILPAVLSGKPDDVGDNVTRRLGMIAQGGRPAQERNALLAALCAAQPVPATPKQVPVPVMGAHPLQQGFERFVPPAGALLNFG